MIFGLPRLWGYGIAVLVAAMFLAGVFGAGYSRAKDKYQSQLFAERAAAKAEYDAQAAEIERVKQRWAQALGDVNEVKARLDAASDYGKSLGERLRYYQTRRCPGMPQAPADPAETGGEGEVASLDERIGQATEQVFADCKVDAERLTLLQNWYNSLRDAQ